MGRSFPALSPPKFTVDHPFVFIIYSDIAEISLFTGQITKPY